MRPCRHRFPLIKFSPQSLPCKGFYDTVAADIFLNEGIQRRKAVADALECRSNLFGLFCCGDGCKGQNDQHAERQLHIYRKDHEERKAEQ